MANKLVLRITGPDGATQEIIHDSPESLILGSGPGAALRLDDPKVAGVHCMLKVEAGKLSVIDLGSEGGTRAGGEPVKAPTRIDAGCLLELGQTKVQIVSFGEPKPAAEPVGSKAGKKGGRKAESAPAVSVGAAGRAACLFNEELPPEESPTQEHKTLEVAMLWGDTVINVRQFRDVAQVRIGAAPRNDFNVFSPQLGDSFTLASCDGKECVVRLPQSAGAALRRGDAQRTREQLAADGALSGTEVAGQTLTLQLHDRAQVTVDNVAFVLRWVRPHKLATAGAASFDFYFTKILTTTGMAGIVLLAAIFMTDINAESLSEDLLKNPQRFAKLVIKPPDKEKKKLELKLKEKAVKQEKVEEKYGQYKKDDTKQRPGIDVNKREQDRKKVMNAGLLGLLGGGDGATSNVFGQGGLGTGINQALGSLKSDSGVSDSGGVGGLGSRGTGPGGGGTGLGLGGLGTKGGGRGGRGGYGSIDLGGRGKTHTRVVPGKTTVTGSCERSVIGTVINRHANEIRYCYEVELNKEPNLAGKVAVSFTIDPTGAVGDASIAESTVGNGGVEQCILTRIRRWRFPEPKGGGICVINYPWVFKPAGGDEGGEE